MRIKRLSLYLVAAVATSCLLGAATTFASQSKPSAVTSADSLYPVLDSGVWADTQHNSYLFWIDNDRVLFKNAEFADKRKAYHGRFNLAVWDTRTNKVTPHTDYAQGVRACYADGYLSYVLYDDRVVKNYAEQLAKKRIRYFAGPFGKEQPLTVPAQHMPTLNEFRCRFITDLNHPVYRKDRIVKPLKDGHGHLEYAVRSLEERRKTKYLYVRSGSSSPIELPMTQEEFLYVSYHDFKGAYFLLRSSNAAMLPPREPQEAWWLYPSGKVEEVEIPPHDEPNQHWGKAYPIQDGFFVGFSKCLPITEEDRKKRYYPSRQKYRCISTAYYRISNSGKVENVISGITRSTVVSPNGCKVAFIHYEHEDATLVADPRPITLKSINFCREETKP